ncbi:MAG: LytTR family DNA-binding domain-containing protein [Pyrinomonadaceae bacterium]
MTKDNGKTIRTLIVDDEAPARKRIRDLLKSEERFEIVGESSNGKDAAKAINDLNPDLVFLDIQLQDMTGFDVIENIDASAMPVIVFVTAFDEFAIRAFKFHALDYLLKPFDDERFEETLKVASQHIKRKQIDDLSERLSGLLYDYRNQNSADRRQKESAYQKRIIIKSTGKVAFIDVRDIDWISAEGYYVSIRAKGRSHLIRQSLKHLEKTLDPQKFLRIHRSTIVNIDRIKELHSHFHGEFFVLLNDGTEFKLSRSYRENAEKLLGGKL